VQEYELALKDEQKMRVFMNTVLGLPFKVRGDAPGWNRLWERRENYPLRVVPKGGLVLTAGVDVQKDRLEAEIVAWGRDKQSWSIDYRVFPGDTATEAPWRALADTLTDLFPHERTGVLMPIMMCAIDSGYNTTHVHSFARRQRADQVILTRGADALAVPVGQPKAAETVVGKRRTRRGLKTWPVGVSLLKQELYSWLRLETPAEGAYPAGFCHFPEYDPEFFRQLTAEELQTKRVSGQSRQMWVKTRERNEALDCRIYARAAAIVAGLDRWSDKKWTEIEESVGVGMPEPAPEAKTDPQTQEINPKRTIERRKSGYWRS
jgi:phage terminase large subunit GpA-like protein